MRTGDVVADRFEIERVAGRGGMAVVYRAIDRTTGSAVALKVLLGDGPELTARFVQESQALADIEHSGVVRWIAQGETVEGMRYIAMEWLEGISLSERLASGPLSVPDALALAARVADALGAAHARGIIHRDVKPQNLFLVGGDVTRVKILDFGIARLNTALVLTRTGVNPGTPSYMAPEQARGERGIDARADVFSLGGVLFRCLAGRAPFVGEDVMAVLAKLVFDEAPRVSDVRAGIPRVVDDLVARLLSKDPDGRPPDGDAAASEIREVELLADSVDATPAPRASLGVREQRILCVVLAGTNLPLDGDSEDVTVADGRPGRLEEARRLALGSFGARAELVATGSLVVTIAGTGAATDLASRAARCALAIQSVLPGEPMAIATGRGILGDRLPIGEAIDRAAVALRGADSSGGIRLDEVTAGLLDARFDVGGDSSGLVLRGERPEAAGGRTVLGRATPFVGRDRERNLLRGLFEDVQSGAGAGAVLVTGPAGSGKSRLRDELLAQVSAGAEPPEVWLARGDPIRSGAPFGLVGGALRDAAGMRATDDAGVRWQKLRARVRRDVAEADVDRVSEFLGELAGVRSPAPPSPALRAARADAVLMGDQMQRAFADLVAGAARSRALVLVLEDLHWGDGPSLRIVESTLRSTGDRPVFVLSLARPEGLALARPLSGRLLAEVRLGELPRRACEGLVRSVLGAEVAGEIVDRIVERAEGNPFALEELLRAEAAGKGGDAPATMLATVQTRLESLPVDERRVLRAASVFGRSFTSRGVAALVGEDPSVARDRLAGLVEGEVIADRVDRGDVFVFRHALLRDAAYAMLTDEDRVLGHRLAAEFLSGGQAEGAVLAEHFERGGDPASAAPHWLRAARQALEGNDFGDAIAWAERAAACGLSGAALGACRLVEAEAHRWRGEFAEAKGRAEEALESLRDGEDWYRAAEEFAQTCHARGDAEGIVRIAEDLLARDDPPDGPRLLAAARIAAHLLLAGHYEPASRLFAWLDSVSDVPAAGFPAVAARLHTAYATRAHFDGDPATFLARLREAAACHEAAGDLRSAGVQRKNAGFGCLEVGAFEEAEALLRSVLEAAARMGASSLEAYARHDLGLVLARLGRVEEGLAEERAAVSLAVAQRHLRLEGTSRIYLATILALSRTLDEAEREAERAVTLLAAAPPARCFALATLAYVRLSRGRTAEALATAREASALLASLGRIDEGEALVRLVLAQALDETGRAEEAGRAWTEAKERLAARAGRIADPALRESFLARVPENAQTLAR